MRVASTSGSVSDIADVVIAGGSYTGLTLALAFAREFGSEARIVVVDRMAKPVSAAAHDDNDPRASAISAASRNLLKALGLWARLQDAAVPVAEIELTDTSLRAGVRRSVLTYDNTSADGVPASWIVPNGRIAAVLNDAVSAASSIKRLYGVTVTGYEADPAGAVLELDGARRIVSQLLVAADGRNSSLRAAAGIRTVGWDHDQIGIVTAIAHEKDHGNRAIQHFLPGGPFAMLPLKGGYRSCVTWSEGADEARRILALDDALFLDEVDRRAAGRHGAVTLDGPRKSWPLETHLARRFIAPRLALVGDAGHGVHPIAGQGLNLGFRDIAALVECVADAARVGLDLGDAGALARYERWRRFDTAVSTATFSGLNRLFSNDIALLRSAREAGLGVLDRLPAVKRMFVNEASGLSGELPKLLRSPSAS
jgi:2-octaprenyl-6-methoxyphenol hydroxylase